MREEGGWWGKQAGKAGRYSAPSLPTQLPLVERSLHSLPFSTRLMFEVKLPGRLACHGELGK